MPQNDWKLGTMYIQPNGPNGYWTQPDGPYTLVYPQQASGNVNYFSTEPFNEKSAQFMFGCGHSVNEAMVFRDYDYENEISVALICCEMCTFIQRIIEPYEDAV